MTDLLRKALRDIASGCTAGSILGRPAFIKHLSYADQIGLEDRREASFQEAKAAGLPTSDEKMALLKKQGLWTDEKELALHQAHQQIPSLQEAKRKHANMPSLVTLYAKQIVQAEKEYAVKEIERRQLLELTCEVYAERCTNDYYIVSNLFEDAAMTRPLFSDEAFDWLQDEAVSTIVADYNRLMEGCSDHNLKRLAMQGFFQRSFQLAGDNLTVVFGKPILQLTNYQIDLLRYGAHFRSIYQQHDVSTFPKEALDDPDLLTDHAVAITKGKQEMAEKGASDPHTSVVGGTSTDRRALGVSANMSALKEMTKLGR